jgi:hypothetical protein
MGKVTRMRSTTTSVGAVAYAAGDEIANSATAGSVVRATFDLSGFTRGRILAAELDVTPASGNMVITAADFELLLFRTPDAPAAVGDNVTMPIAANVRCKAVGRFRFDDGAWTNPLGALTASTSGVQAVMPALVQPLATPVQEYPVPFFAFSFEGQAIAARELTAVIRALAAWTPANVVNTFGITLDLDLE